MMCGIGKKCNELLTDIFNQGNMNWIWPHFPSVTMTYIRADKADEVPLSNRKLTLNYVYQWEKLLLNSSELIQRFFSFCIQKGNGFLEQKLKKKNHLRLRQAIGIIDWFGKHRVGKERAMDMKHLHLRGLSCI